MPEHFAHLHVHTEYSMLDGAARLSPLFAEAARLGQSALALTDHGNMFGAYTFYQEAKKAGITPILGIEAYVAPGDRTLKQAVRWGRPDQRDDDVSGNGAYTHMTMLARNATGLRNLFRMSSRASIEGYYYKPRMDRDLIAAHADGIIATTGCPGGEVQTRLRLDQFDAALQAAADYRDIFGPDNFYVELMEHGNAVEKRVADELADIAKKLNLPPLVTNDSHYVTESQADDHAALLCVQSGKTLDDPKRFKFDGDGYHLKSADEMYRLRGDEMWQEGCRNTMAVAQRIESYDEVFAHAERMPTFSVPEGHTAESWLAHEVDTGLTRAFPAGVPEEYRQRAKYELEVVSSQGYPGYFLVVADLIDWAKRQGIRVGPGRGSAVGSLIAYATGITGADPIAHGLLFERFLNPERVSQPDIDIDFDDRRRAEVITYVGDKYGHDKIAQVITFGTIKAKAALKDAARILHGSEGFAIADKISKAMPAPVLGKDIPLAGIVDADHERYAEAIEVRTLLDNDPASKQIFDTARGLEGLIRQAGVHACAVIMSSQPIMDDIPVWARPQDGAVITGFDYPVCEDMGLLKMDFLGLRNLTVIGDALALIETNRASPIDLDAIGMDDAAAFALLGRGDTLGVFQLDGTAMRELLRRMQPSSFADIAAVLALYRPGPMGVGAHNDYADRKNGRQNVTAIHPELAEPLQDILAETYGLIVYQEQIMRIAQKVASFSLGQADVLRKAMGKKKLDVLEEQFQLFESGMQANGYSAEAITVLWETILPFAGYAFNKSHAVAYGLIAYHTAYLKANYTPEYMAALLTSVGDSKDRAAMYLAECRKLGVQVLSPDVNESAHQFAAVGEDIRFGLGAIRNVGANVVASIVANRDKKGKYETFHDFLSKVDAVACNKRSIESLIKAGAFDSLHHPRAGLAQIHASAVDAVMTVKKEEAKGQYDLFGALNESDPALKPGADIDIPDHEWDRAEKLAIEKDMLGLYVSEHPLDGYEPLLKSHSDRAISALLAGDIADGTSVQIAGIITSLEKRVTKKGKLWAKATIEDLDAGIETCFFPQTFEAFGEVLAPDLVCTVRGKTDARDGGTPQLMAHDISPIDTTNARQVTNAQPHEIVVPVAQVSKPFISDLTQTLHTHPGDSTVHIILQGDGGDETRLELPDQYCVKPTRQLEIDLKTLIGAHTSR